MVEAWQLLLDEQFAKKLDDNVRHQIVQHDDVAEAEFVVLKFAPLVEVSALRRADVVLYQRYEDMINLCRLVAVSTLNERELLDFMQAGIAVFFQTDDIDIMAKMNGYLVAIRNYVVRDQLKAKLRVVLKKNNEIIGAKDKKIKLANELVEPTLSNWLYDYDATVGPTGIPDTLKKNQYLTNSENMKGLNEEIRNRWREFLNWYDRLKLSSLTPEGIEDFIGFEYEGKQYVLKYGQIDEINPQLFKEQAELEQYLKGGEMMDDQGRITNPPGWHKNDDGEWVEESPTAETAVSKPVSVAAVLPTIKSSASLSAQPALTEKKTPTAMIDADEARRIEAALAMMRMMPGDPVPALLLALTNKKLIEVQGYLRYFALSGDLPDLMVHPEIMKLFKPYLEKKMGQAASLAYTSKPKRPQYVKLFLQWILQEELGLSPEAASARRQPIMQILAVDDAEFS